MNLVQQYWRGVQRRLQAEVEGFNSLIAHQGEKGRENELSLARVLGSLIPTRYGMGSGLIFDSMGQESSQTDIIIYDAVDEPAILAQTNQVLFPVENVRAAIEVKTSVGKPEVEDIGAKVLSTRGLKQVHGYAPPLYGAVGYRATQTIGTIAKQIKALKTDQVDKRPDLLLVLDTGLIGLESGLAQALGYSVPSGLDYLVGVAPVQQSDQGGSPVMGAYVPAPEDDQVGCVHEGDYYKIHHAPTHGYYLADSARALLLFADAILTALATSSGRPAPGFHHYITAEMRDLLLVSDEVV